MAARGLWIEMLCIAHAGTPYGHVTINGRAPAAKQIAMIVGATEATVKQLLAELENSGVFNRSHDETIYSRRMVRDQAARDAGREFGKQGGNPALTGRDIPSGKPSPLTGGLTPPLSPQEAEAEAEAEAGKKAGAMTRRPAGKKTPPVSAGASEPVTLPAWLPVQPWNDFVANRKQLRKPLGDGAARLLIAKLDRWRLAGHDVAAILNESTAHGWQGLFEPKGQAAGAARPGRDEWAVKLANVDGLFMGSQ